MIGIGIAIARTAVAIATMQCYCTIATQDCCYNNDDYYIFIVITSLSGSCGIEGEDESYDFGTGAGFYIDATEEKWKTNYRMFSYVTKEVVKLAKKN